MSAADAARGEHRPRRHLADDLRPQHDGPDIPAVAAAFATLGDDDVDIGLGVFAGLRGGAAQSCHLAAGLVNVVDHVGRRGPQRVGDQGHLRVSQGHLDLRGRRRLGPSEQLQGV